MKSIKYNPTLAYSVLLAAILVRDNQALEVDIVNSNTDDELEREFKKTFPAVNLETNYAVSLLKDSSFQNSPNKRGSDFAKGIVGRYHDVRNYDTQNAIYEVFGGNRDTIKKVSEAGSVIGAYENSPIGSSPRQGAISEQDEAELHGSRGSFRWEDTTTKDKVIFNPHPLGKWIVFETSRLEGTSPGITGAEGLEGPNNQEEIIGEKGPVGNNGIEDKGYGETQVPQGDLSIPETNTDIQAGQEDKNTDGKDDETNIGSQGSEVQGDVGISSAPQAPETKTDDNVSADTTGSQSKKPEARKRVSKESVSSDKNPLKDKSVHVENNITAGTDGVKENETDKPSDLSEQKPLESDITENTDKKQ